jgi:hypothetical protein
MAAGGYAGLPRFVAPAVGVVCALGASGLVSLAAGALAPRPAGLARGISIATAALAVAFVVQGGVRSVQLGDAASDATTLSAAHEDLRALVEAGGPERLRGCAPIAVGAIEGQTALAWRLDVPIEAIDVSRTLPPRGLYLDRTDGGWRAAELGCPNLARVAGWTTP